MKNFNLYMVQQQPLIQKKNINSKISHISLPHLCTFIRRPSLHKMLSVIHQYIIQIVHNHSTQNMMLCNKLINLFHIIQSLYIVCDYPKLNIKDAPAFLFYLYGQAYHREEDENKKKLIKHFIRIDRFMVSHVMKELSKLHCSHLNLLFPCFPYKCYKHNASKGC